MQENVGRFQQQMIQRNTWHLSCSFAPQFHLATSDFQKVLLSMPTDKNVVLYLCSLYQIPTTVLLGIIPPVSVDCSITLTMLSGWFHTMAGESIGIAFHQQECLKCRAAIRKKMVA